MAGSRQHILPRFLLKGFASRVQDKKVFSWVYRKGFEAFEASIRDICVEEDFYGKNDELSVDSEITKLEPDFALLLDEVRNTEDRAEVINPKIADFITHLCIRTKHLRDSTRESYEYLVLKLEEYLSDFNNLKDHVFDSPLMIDCVLENISKQIPVSEDQKNQLKQLLPYFISKYFNGKQFEIEALTLYFFQQVKTIPRKKIKESHIKALTKNTIPEPRAEMYRNMHWFVLNTDVPLLLGDVGCVFEVEGKNHYRALTGKNDEIKAIYLPISSKQMLVGTAFLTPPPIDYHIFIEKYVKCCREFFICPKPSPHNYLIAQKIGLDSDLISKEELDRIVLNLFNEK